MLLQASRLEMSDSEAAELGAGHVAKLLGLTQTQGMKVVVARGVNGGDADVQPVSGC
jgi:hypothetical protein